MAVMICSMSNYPLVQAFFRGGVGVSVQLSVFYYNLLVIYHEGSNLEPVQTNKHDDVARLRMLIQYLTDSSG